MLCEFSFIICDEVVVKGDVLIKVEGSLIPLIHDEYMIYEPVVEERDRHLLTKIKS